MPHDGTAHAGQAPTAPTTPLNLEALTLDELRTLAEHGRDASTRAAARRAVDVRTAPTAELSPTYKLSVDRSEFGTPIPTVRLMLAGRARDARAAGFELAADLERSLSATREGWRVEVSSDDSAAMVRLHLMDGTPAEVRRALNMLEPLVGEAATTGRAARRRPGRKPRATTPAPAPAVEGEADSPQDGAALEHVGVAAPVRLDDAIDGRARRRKRARYREVTGGAAGAFEAAQLERPRAELPPCAVVALEGGAKTGEYWDWLLGQYEAQQPAIG
jgi:hypothetical protein